MSATGTEPLNQVVQVRMASNSHAAFKAVMVYLIGKYDEIQ